MTDTCSNIRLKNEDDDGDDDDEADDDDDVSRARVNRYPALASESESREALFIMFRVESGLRSCNFASKMDPK